MADLRSALAAEKRRAEAAEARVADLERRDRARVVIAEMQRPEVSSLAVLGLLEELQVTESGDLDEAALKASVTSYADEVRGQTIWGPAPLELGLSEMAASVGGRQGAVRGFGAFPASSGDPLEEVDAAVAAAFGRGVEE